MAELIGMCLCEACTPSGCKLEVFSARPMQKCEVCGADGEHWFTKRDDALLGLIRHLRATDS